MNEVLIFCAGAFMGAAVVFLYALDRIEAHREEAEDHIYAAWEMARKLGEANRNIEHLEEQNESLMQNATFSKNEQV